MNASIINTQKNEKVIIDSSREITPSVQISKQI